MDPLTIAALSYGAPKVISGITDILGGNASADAQKRAQRGARNNLTQGYGQATGFQKPIYNTGVGTYTNLAKEYASGGFNPNWDPNSVFQDPEFKAQMDAGRAAFGNDANANGTQFSTASDRDLTRFGHDLFSKRSDVLYNRMTDANKTRFNEGVQISQPGFQAAGNLSNLAVEQGQDLAENTLGSGQIRANNFNNTSNVLGDLASYGGNLVGKRLMQKTNLLGTGQSSGSSGARGLS